MKQKFLALLVMAAGACMVACDDGGSSAGTTCQTNPTMQGCSLQAAALAQVQGTPESATAKALQAQNPALAQVNLAGPTINPQTGAGTTNVPAGTTVVMNGVPVPVSNARLPDTNPLSPNFKGQSNAVLASDTSRTPAAASDAGEAPIGIEGAGEAAR